MKRGHFIFRPERFRTKCDVCHTKELCAVVVLREPKRTVLAICYPCLIEHLLGIQTENEIKAKAREKIKTLGKERNGLLSQTVAVA
jgi:hypothetical protein